MDEIIVPVNRFKILLVALACLAFVAVAVPLVVIGASQGGLQVVGWLVFGLADVAFFGSGLVFAAQKLMGSAPMLEINASGIKDNSSMLAAGFVPWKEITGWHVAQLGMQGVLCLIPADADRFLKSQPLWRRLMMKQNLWLVGSPFVLSPAAMEISLQKLAEVVDHHLRNVHPEAERTVIHRE